MIALGDGAAYAQDNLGGPTDPDGSSAAEQESTVALPEMTVLGEPLRAGENDYYTFRQITGTRMQVPIEDVPQSIQVLAQNLIKDQRIRSPNEAMRNIAGVVPVLPTYSIFQRFRVRGFRIRDVYKNGLLAIGFNRTHWLGNVARIEVLKGPSAALYGGALNAWGIINYVSKKPLPKPTFTGSVSVGSYDFTDILLDASAPITNHIAYRVTAEIKNSGSFIDRAQHRGKFVSGVLDMDLGDNTTLILRSEARKTSNEGLGRVGLPAFGTIVGLDEVKLPLERNFNPPFAQRENFAVFASAELLHRFNDVWSFKSHTKITHFEMSQARLSTNLRPDNRTLDRTVYFVDANREDYRTNNMAIAEFQTGSIEHKLLLGLTLAHQTIAYQTSRGDLAPINIVNPVYGAQATNVHLLADQSTDLTTAALYIQDLVTLYPGVKLLLGGRFNYVHRELSDPVTGFDESKDDLQFSPRAGLVFQPTPWASIYASYSTAYSPQGVFSSKSGTERLVEAETGQQYEVGVKLNLPSRLTATLAAYHLTRENVRTTVEGEVSFVGERVSKGIELSLAYQILPGWNALVAYAYTDSQITEDNEFKEGNRPRNVPRNTLRLWTSYTVQNGPLSDLMVGVGMYYAGERYGDKANTFKLPSYTVWDVTVSYPVGRYTFALDFSNLFDERYFEAASSRNHVFPGKPFTVMGTVSVTF